VQELVQQIRPNYDDISTHQIFKKKRRMITEVDILARKGDEIHIYEVKCSYRITKARKQLNRARGLFRNQKTACFFYCGIGKALVEI
jgi:Holliday junction resolvase-like predicted endonuclease